MKHIKLFESYLEEASSEAEMAQALTEVNQMFAEEDAPELQMDIAQKAVGGDEEAAKGMEKTYSANDQITDIENSEHKSLLGQAKFKICSMKKDKKSLKAALKEALHFRKMNKGKSNEQAGTITILGLTGPVGIWLAIIGFIVVMITLILLGMAGRGPGQVFRHGCPAHQGMIGY
jgi:type I site-specific restriction endonuclease